MASTSPQTIKLPSPNHKKGQLIKMEPFKIPQQGDKPIYDAF
jgi:hypothetical protein